MQNKSFKIQSVVKYAMFYNKLIINAPCTSIQIHRPTHKQATSQMIFHRINSNCDLL